MKAIRTLPEGYEEFFSVDLQKNKKLALLVNLLAIAIAVVLIVPAAVVVPISHLFSVEGGLAAYAARFIAILVLSVVYIILHECVHGIAMKMCGTKKVKYGFTGLYAFAGSDEYYDKKSYIFIALAPVILWGVVIAIINPFVPTAWFWVVYFIQIMNLSGAAGDLYVTCKFLHFPKHILVKDSGVAMTVYSKEIR